jgi:hypothetical protein
MRSLVLNGTACVIGSGILMSSYWLIEYASSFRPKKYDFWRPVTVPDLNLSMTVAYLGKFIHIPVLGCVAVLNFEVYGNGKGKVKLSP